MTTNGEFLFSWWIDEPAKPALVAATATAATPPPPSATKRLSGWEAGAKKDAKGDGGGSSNVTAELK